MEYEMKFCVGCYLPLAMDLTAKLLEANSHDEELSLKIQPGKAGSFEIFRDGELIFSRAKTGKLPNTADLDLGHAQRIEQDLNSENSGSCC
jgi:selT/selW/selH-like putative selenoprotein